MSEVPTFSRPVEISTIGAGELVKKIEASEKERLEIVAALGLVGVSELIAELALSRDDNGVIHLAGRVGAEIVQNCVVSLDPVDQTINEEISLTFIQEGTRSSSATKAEEIAVDPMLDDPPELVSGPILDLGPIVLEHFILAIDPYPRVPGVAAPANPAEDGGETSDSPFAVLEKLRLSKTNDN